MSQTDHMLNSPMSPVDCETIDFLKKDSCQFPELIRTNRMSFQEPCGIRRIYQRVDYDIVDIIDQTATPDSPRLSEMYEDEEVVSPDWTNSGYSSPQVESSPQIRSPPLIVRQLDTTIDPPSFADWRMVNGRSIVPVNILKQLVTTKTVECVCSIYGMIQGCGRGNECVCGCDDCL